MRVVIFGTGKLYQNNKGKIKSNVEIVAFIDNNSRKWGGFLDGKIIYSVSDIVKLDYDYIYLMSVDCAKMRKQLLDMGIQREKIISDYHRQLLFGEEPVIQYGTNVADRKGKVNLLVFSHALTSTGAQNVLFYGLKSLKENNAQIVVVSGEDGPLRDRFCELDITVMIISDIFQKRNEIYKLCAWSDIIVVNTLLLYETVMELIQYNKKIIWWIHETGLLKDISDKDYQIIAECNNIKIFTVGQLVKRRVSIYCKKDIRILNYGLSEYQIMQTKASSNTKVIFGLIASIGYIKGQDILIKAVSKLSKDVRDKTEFWIVGRGVLDDKDLNLARTISSIKILGEVDNREISKLYQQIDIVVCPSREDAMPVAVAEGCMNYRPAIVSDATGISEILENGINTLIFESENVSQLSECIQWMVENPVQVRKMGEAARDIYDKYFAMDIFEKNLLEIISGEYDSQGYNQY